MKEKPTSLLNSETVLTLNNWVSKVAIGKVVNFDDKTGTVTVEYGIYKFPQFWFWMSIAMSIGILIGTVVALVFG